ncbi:hypothetical protein EIP91_006316 [Steccherinum ochraceum]|uniref:Major facilitator superfamily (MFS) profile domain-containing protein n=1 Tax=Steccherinum ochraceum TaxID=92696 RepID=A0A4R0RM13_9APHY|nr:hypothetical protein EIP91_006316 [Steccherinum ochraceum]
MAMITEASKIGSKIGLGVDAYELSVISKAPEPAVDSSWVEQRASSLRSDLPDSDTAVHALPPFDGGWRAWTFVAAGFVLETFIWGFNYSYGVFQNYYTSHPPFEQSSHVAVASIGPTGLAIMFTEGLLLSFFHTRYPDYMKYTLWTGLTLFVLALLLSSFVSDVALLIFLQGICLGVGGGMMYWPSLSLLPEWFVQRRGLASGIMFAGGGVGGFVFPLVVEALLSRIGFRWTLRIWALLMAVVGGVAILGVRPRVPVPKFHAGHPRPAFFPANTQFHKRPVFWCFTLTYWLQGMCFYPVSLYIAVFTATIASPLSAATALSLFNSAGVIGQVLMGYFTDRWPYPRIMFGSALGCCLSAFLLWGFADTLGTIFAFAVLFGGLGGGFPSVLFAAATDSAGANPEQATTALTAVTAIKGIAAVLGPIASSLLLEAGKKSSSSAFTTYGKGGFGPVIVFVGSCAAVTSLSTLAVAAARLDVRPRF